MLKGEAKKVYQRNYMKRKRSNETPVRPIEMLDPKDCLAVRPYSKEAQLSVRASKKQVNKEATFNTLKTIYDVRSTL